MDDFPKKKELMDAIIAVLQGNGAAMKTAEIDAAVAKKMNISAEMLAIEDANCTGSEYSYRMRWARTELKQKGKIVNLSRGVWGLHGSNLTLTTKS